MSIVFTENQSNGLHNVSPYCSELEVVTTQIFEIIPREEHMNMITTHH